MKLRRSHKSILVCLMVPHTWITIVILELIHITTLTSRRDALTRALLVALLIHDNLMDHTAIVPRDAITYNTPQLF